MVTLDYVKRKIAETLAIEKVYGLPNLCLSYGLESGAEEESNISKKTYRKKG